MTPRHRYDPHYGFDASGNLTTLPAGAAGTYDSAGELTSAALVRHDHQLHLQR